MKIKSFIEKLSSIPKSMYVSLRLFPLTQAVRLPILVRYNTKIVSLNGLITVNRGGVKTGMMQIGFGHVNIFDKRHERSMLELNGTISLSGTTCFGAGSRISVSRGAVLSLGDKFVNTAKCTIVCADKLTIGNNVLVSWDTLIMDTDWHETININTMHINEKSRPIEIGNNVWIAARATILKGSKIGNGSIVGAGVVITKQYDQENVVIAGNPARVVKDKVTRNIH